MGLRFQRRLAILPGVRLNLSKRGVSTSLGPRGADVNIGPGGITTNAGLPGTGLSYRSRLGTHGGWLGVVLVAAGLAFWGGTHFRGAAQPSQAPAAAQSGPPPASSGATTATLPGLRYVHRGNSVLRDKPKASGHTLKKEAKGVTVTLVSEDGGWAKVTDGNISGWMRASVLGVNPPP